MLTDTLKPDFTLALKEDICAEICRRTANTVEALSTRDEDFLTWDRQAEGDPYWAGIPVRWDGGCDIEDPMTDEYAFETIASLSYIQGQQDWYQVEATEDGDEQPASDIEAFLNDEVIRTELNTRHMYDLLDQGFRHSYGVLAVEWKQEIANTYTPVWQHKKTLRTLPADSPEPGLYPDEYELTEEVGQDLISDGIEMRVPNTGDVYLDPPSAQSFQKAARIIERFEYTEDDLLNGIGEEGAGFDAKKVEDLLKAGPTGAWVGSYAEDRNSTEDIPDENVWVVYRVIGYAPSMLQDGRSRLKDSQRKRQYEWMVCPEKGICFKFVPFAYRMRPYAKYPFRGRTNRMVGYSGCSMLAPLQQESTSAFRFRIDFRDLYMSSPLLVPDSWYEEFQRFEAFPGANLPYPTQPPSALGPGAIAPLPFNPAGYSAAMQDGQDIRARASSLFSADARGPATTQQRTATEAGQAAAGADEKLDLLLLNFHLGVRDTADIILSHYAQFGGSDGVSRFIGSKAITVTPEMLAKRYRIMATGNSENASPVIRLQRDKMLIEVMKVDPVLAMKIQQGDMTGAYFLMGRLYRSLGIRNPQAVMGQEPTPPPNAEYILQAVMGMAQQFAKAGDPGAQAIMQGVQQLMQPQGQPGMPGVPGMGQMAPQGAPMGMGGGMPPGGEGMGALMPSMPPGGGMNPAMNGAMNGGGMPMPMGVGM